MSERKAGKSDKATLPRRPTKPKPPVLISLERSSTIEQTASQKARLAPQLLSPRDVLQLQRTMGNRAMGRVLASVQRRRAPAPQSQPVQREDPSGENRTGMPDGLKAGVENLSGTAMDDVRVHYNSSKPAELQALAYTYGTDIHLGPGQEEHLPHEAWHVAQQKQGRVQPTAQMQSMEVNEDPALEREADVMGARALQAPALRGAVGDRPVGGVAHRVPSGGNPVAQMMYPITAGKDAFSILDKVSCVHSNLELN
jgi:hypothetical protein